MRKTFSVLFVVLLMMHSLFVFSSFISAPVEALDYGMDTDLGSVNASFWGEDAHDLSGISVAVAGDVNGDGYDDILIGSHRTYENLVGETYLIFGKASGWAMDVDLSDADASFLGENDSDYAGEAAGAGDVNGDGYDDIIIGTSSSEGGKYVGQTYLIFGKASGWAMDTDLSTAHTSFWGENKFDFSGISVAGAGDVNGDGFDDILIGASGNDERGDSAGQTYLIFGKKSGWAMDTNLSSSDASFLGENAEDNSGFSVTGAGDVNGDGYDDILIGAYGDLYNRLFTGRTYLIFGKSAGWSMDTNLSASDASFRAEKTEDRKYNSFAGGGDVNGDGFDDIMIGVQTNGDGSYNAGQTYLIFGKASGWAMDTNLSLSDASFLGENVFDHSGSSVAGAGDANGDGYDDILISSEYNTEASSNAGQTYLILGKNSGWAMDTNISSSDASFWGEAQDDYSGRSIAGAGDINGDGYDDFMICALSNDDGGGDSAGQTYLIFPDHNSGPVTITSIKAYSDDEYLNEITSGRPGDKIYLELQGTDADPRRNIAQVWLKGSSAPNARFILRLLETGENTGKFRGEFTITNRTHKRYHWIDASRGGWIEISSKHDPMIRLNFSTGPGIHIDPRPPYIFLNEDEGYSLHFNITGVTPDSCIFYTDASWLTWNENNETLFGTPTNVDVGTYSVYLGVAGSYYSDEITFPIVVYNTPPEISLLHKYFVSEDEILILDLNSTDEGEGNVTWDISSDAYWLRYNRTSGILTGNPTNLDVGTYYILATIDDGNGGSDFLNFTLDVLNTPPMITTRNIEEIQQDKYYFNDYNSTDDGQGNIIWHLTTNATWLSIDTSTGVLNGTPTNDDVGVYLVNVSVSDGNGGWDYTAFTLDVGNVNNPPLLYNANLTPSEGDTSTNFTFSVMYKDIDRDEPIDMRICLDLYWYPMTTDESGPLDFSKGVQYDITLNLTEGIHSYHYYVSDGIIGVRLPLVENLTTPYVQYVSVEDMDSDNDTYNDTFELEQGSDPYDPLSTPLDIDADGWNNTVEVEVGTDPRDNTSFPPDMDLDGIYDSIDPDRDGDGVLNVDDAFPDDRSKWDETEEVEEGSGIVWWITGIAVFVIVVGVIVGVMLVGRRKRIGEEVVNEGGAVDKFGRVEKGGEGDT